jgi:hypothetical protein
MEQSNGKHKSNMPEQLAFPFEHLTAFPELQFHSFRTLHPLEKNNNFLFSVLHRSSSNSGHCRAAHTGITSRSRHPIRVGYFVHYLRILFQLNWLLVCFSCVIQRRFQYQTYIKSNGRVTGK